MSLTLTAEIAAGLACAYAALSVAEWYVHSRMMHRPGWFNRLDGRWFHNHQIVHHAAYRRDFTAPDPERHRDIGVPSSVVGMTIGSLAIAAPMAFVWPVGAACLVLLAASHGVAWTAFHREMHSPRGRWFARTRWYRACLRHHERHHLYPRTNFCALFLGADLFLGTARRERP
jgi:hypothetical protein